MRSDSPSAGREEYVKIDEANSHKDTPEVESSADSEHFECNDDSSKDNSTFDDIFFTKSLDENSKESERDINTMLGAFKKRGSATYGNPSVDYRSDQMFQHNESVDKISVKSSDSPLSVEHVWQVWLWWSCKDNCRPG